MRIFHFTNIPLDIDQIRSAGKDVHGGGGWMSALLGRLLQDTDFEFACATFGKVKHVVSSQTDRITGFVIPEKGKENALKLCRDLVNGWKPDLIHIHGTENAYGLLSARNMISFPTIISLQGLLGPCSEWYRYFGNRTLIDILQIHRWLEFPALRGHWIGYLRINQMAKREMEIIRGNRFFMGRTAWDRAYVGALNPSANYFLENRILREDFWKKKWELNEVKRHRIIFTNPGHPRKGTETLLDAVEILRPFFPDIKVCFAGNIRRRSGYGRYISKRIALMEGVAVELGALNAMQMTEELIKSHVFVSPSFIDNSPNAVAEAQLVGMPVVSTYTGGVPSMIEEGKTGLFFPTGDAPMLAARLREIFDNDALAVCLGKNSHHVAAKRHDPDAVVQQVLSAYDAVFKYSMSKPGQKVTS